MQMCHMCCEMNERMQARCMHMRSRVIGFSMIERMMECGCARGWAHMSGYMLAGTGCSQWLRDLVVMGKRSVTQWVGMVSTAAE